MNVVPVKIRLLNPPQDNLLEALETAIKEIKNQSILAISSKVVSIWESQCVLISEYPEKDTLVKKEADLYLPRSFAPKGWVMHTIKNGLFVPTAGIDLNKPPRYYILWPQDPMKSAEKIREHFKKKFDLKNFGVIITDSHSTPFHRGTIGITLGFAGFNPIKDYRKQKDLFGREFVVEMANIADQLSSAALTWRPRRRSRCGLA